MKMGLKRVAMEVLATAGLFAAAARQAQAAPFDTRIPADAAVYVGWAGTGTLAGQYAGSNLKQILRNTRLGPFVMAHWQEWMSKAQVNPEQAKDAAEAFGMVGMLLRHPVALYLGPTKFIPGNPPVSKMALLVDGGTDAPQLLKWLEKIEQNPRSPQVKETFSLDKTTIILTLGETSAADFTEKPDCLQQAAGFKSSVGKMPSNAALTVFVDAEKMVSSISQAVEASPIPLDAKKRASALIDGLGLHGLTQMAYACGFDKKEWIENGFVGMKGPRTGIPAMMDTSPLSDDALKAVPKNALLFAAGKLDVPKLLADVRSLVGKLAPQQVSIMERSLAQLNAVAGIDVEKDLLDPLGDEWVAYRMPASDVMAASPWVLVHKLRDPATLEKTLAVLADKLKTVTQGRVFVEKLDTGDMSADVLRLPYLTIAWTIRGNYWYISSFDGISAAVDQVEKKQSSILDDRAYQALRATFPEVKPSGATYSQPARLYPEFYDLMMTFVVPAVRIAGVAVPGDVLPAPRTIAPYLTPGGSITWTGDDGFHYTSRSSIPAAALLGGQVPPTTSVAGASMMAAILLPALGKARQLANRTVDAANLRGLAMSCIVWAGENDEAMPDHLGRLIVHGQITPRQLVSKESGTAPLNVTPAMLALAEDDFASFAAQVDQHCDYVYLGKGMKDTTDSSVVLAYDKPTPALREGMNMVFLDGHVEFVRWDLVRKIFKPTNEYLKEMKLTEVDVDALLKAAGQR